MTISQSQGSRVIPVVMAKLAIKRIIDRNKAVNDAVNQLVTASSEATLEEKRNHSIHHVYMDNPIFADEVDKRLDRL